MKLIQWLNVYFLELHPAPLHILPTAGRTARDKQGVLSVDSSLLFWWLLEIISEKTLSTIWFVGLAHKKAELTSPLST